MKTQKTILALLAAAALTTVAGASQANNTIASTIETNGSATDFTFTGGVGGALSTSSTLGIYAVGPNGGVPTAGTFSFGPITELSAATPDGGGYQAAFSGGSFDITSAGSTTVGDLLMGTFGGAQVASTNGSSGGVLNMSLDSVTYTGGLYQTQYLQKYGAGTGVLGDLSVALSAINPTINSNGAGGGLGAFNAQGSTTTFDATAVPEPSSIALFSIGGFGLMGLALRARKAVRPAA